MSAGEVSSRYAHFGTVRMSTVRGRRRIAFGFRRFDHYRLRALLYAGKPHWALLDTLIPHSNPKRRQTACW